MCSTDLQYLTGAYSLPHSPRWSPAFASNGAQQTGSALAGSRRFDGVPPVVLRQDIDRALHTELSSMLHENLTAWGVALSRFQLDIKQHFDSGKEEIIRRMEEVAKGSWDKVENSDIRAVWESEVSNFQSLSVSYVSSRLTFCRHFFYPQKWNGTMIQAPIFIEAVQSYIMNQGLTPPSETWAHKYLGIRYRKRLIDLFDVDHSGNVSIWEVNDFMRSKPDNQRSVPPLASLPQRMRLTFSI